MPEHLTPGVDVEEISTGPKPIAGVSTDVAGFVGPTERGPEEIRCITSWLAYQCWYGGHLGEDTSYLSYAVQGFFDNGGQRCFVGRIVAGSAVQENQSASRSVDALLVKASGRGAWGNRVFIRVQPATERTKGVENAKDWVRFQAAYFTVAPAGAIIDFTKAENLKAAGIRFPDVFEDYDNLSLDPQAPQDLKGTVNRGSKLVKVDVPGPVPPTLPLGDDFVPLSGGDASGAALVAEDYVGSIAPLPGDPDALLGQGRGLNAMDLVDEVSLLLAPDHVRFANNVINEVVNRCERLKDRFAVMSTDYNFTPAGPTAKPTVDTTFGAQYYPWIHIYDPLTRGDILIPPVGHVAGIMARTDLEQGVHKAPANAVVIGATGLQRPVPRGDQDLLNAVGINCIRDFRANGRGIRLWGARTMSSDPQWKYIHIRRLFLFVEESIDEGTQWVVFEPNAPPTWARVQQSIADFLSTLWRNGALAGATPHEAFFVKCDRTTMTQDDVDQGRLICYIGIAPVRPAEFVIFRIGQWTTDARA